MTQAQLPFDDGWWSRLAQTPMRDALRFKFTDRLSLDRAIHPYNLPPACAELVRQVARKTRLWKMEKADVAAELAAHFRDGLDAGATAQSLIAAFGDPRRAAKLIRRAKIRSRPAAWHAFKWARRIFSTAAVLYLALLVHLLLGRPSVTVDYLRTINKTAEQTSEADRAWPLYRRACLALYPPTPANTPARTWWPGDQTPQTEHWAEATAFFHAHQADLALIRQAAAMPALGYIVRHDGIAAEDKDVFNRNGTCDIRISADPYTTNDPLNEMPVQYIGTVVLLYRLLAADAYLAAQEHDTPRVMNDFQAIFHIADQVWQSSLDQSWCFKPQVEQSAVTRLALILDDYPDLLPDDALQALAHRVATIDPAAELVQSLSAQELFVRDELQRDYTDDGSGNGHITLAGLIRLHEWGYEHPSADYYLRVFGFLPNGDSALVTSVRASLLPLDAMKIADRRQTLAKFADILRTGSAELATPFWRQPVTLADAWRSDDNAATAAPARQYPVLESEVPQWQIFSRRTWVVKSSIDRDALLLGIGLTLYHRRHHRWPEKLDELTPMYIPALPVDPITGGPLRYKITAAGPLIYSVGANRIDDGGVPPAEPDMHHLDLFAPYTSWPKTVPAGDWILWPRAPEHH